MAAISHIHLLTLSFFAFLVSTSYAQLSPTFYSTTCPNLQTIVRSAMTQAISSDSRIAASILRLHFHDCFVNGCDASILLDDTSTFTGEKNAGPNRNSARGYEVIDTIKSQVEANCSGVVSCADILTLAARDGVFLQGGRSWTVPLGRRDARTASQTAANNQIPAPTDSLATLISRFSAKGLNAQEMTALSGSHSIGQAGCNTFRTRIYNETNIDPRFATTRRANCPFTGGDRNLAPLDIQTATQFDNNYFQNLVAQRGLLHSDQVLFNNGSQDALVQTYSQNNGRFVSDFAAAMVKMGNIILSFLAFLVCTSNAQLSPTFYSTTCPNLETIVRNAMTQAISSGPRIAASILRLHFHDCFVNGCDASILLDDTSTFTGEKNAAPNQNSARGYGLIDTIKSQVEANCSGVVSCADILTLAARDGVFLQGGRSWTVPLGRRDARTASQTAANNQIPAPTDSLATLISRFSAKGLNAQDMTVLSGSHSIGQAGCITFRTRIYNETNIDPRFATLRRTNCPFTGGDRNLAPLDISSATQFDNNYFQNLVAQRGLLHSDQVLFNNGSQDALVRTYSQNNGRFLIDFAAAMVKMGNITIKSDSRMAASILRLHFHDCFVLGCEASILLDDTATFTGEKNAIANKDSLRGYEVIDAIKSEVEANCRGVVSCADILALAARDGVVMQGGLAWTVPLGRRDGTTASQTAADNELPDPVNDSLAILISKFAAKGFKAKEMTVLSGSHTIGKASCITFRPRIYNDTNIDPKFAATRRANCPVTGGDLNLAPLDIKTGTRFDNTYFQNLVAKRGLLHTDQVLFNNGSQDAVVRSYSQNNERFIRDFAAAMFKMGNISPLTGTQGEIRKNCRRINY
ncbi:Plant peroxidase [Macleaya cordata]|uniref:peroxidase n=1 Tax=Macleaya cordata TaxID=56857 RepID=A0A200PZR8_MACCD|nr:Plant peroxidase [Macleaya cordata]